MYTLLPVKNTMSLKELHCIYIISIVRIVSWHVEFSNENYFLKEKPSTAAKFLKLLFLQRCFKPVCFGTEKMHTG